MRDIGVGEVPTSVRLKKPNRRRVKDVRRAKLTDSEVRASR